MSQIVDEIRAELSHYNQFKKIIDNDADITPEEAKEAEIIYNANYQCRLNMSFMDFLKSVGLGENIASMYNEGEPCVSGLYDPQIRTFEAAQNTGLFDPRTKRFQYSPEIRAHPIKPKDFNVNEFLEMAFRKGEYQKMNFHDTYIPDYAEEFEIQDSKRDSIADLSMTNISKLALIINEAKLLKYPLFNTKFYKPIEE